MHTILYSSDLAPGQSPTCISAILKTARTANLTHAITGVLLFDGAHFIQCIEGTERQVRQLMDNILHDERHNNVRILADTALPARHFADWRMGYAEYEDDSLYARLQAAAAGGAALQQFRQDVAACELM